MGGKKIPMNRHAAEAMERKNAQKNAKNKAAEDAAEDARWADDGDKKGKKKAAKAQDKADKEREKQAKRDEVKALEREENANLKGKGDAPTKVTRHQIQKEMAKMAAKPTKKTNPNVVSVEDQEKLVNKQNKNKLDEDVDATGVDEAIKQLDKVAFADTSSDDHPERRLKAAHLAYEEKHMPILKADNPGLKHSQLKDLCWKQWQKSPENPMVKEAMKRHKLMQSQQ